MRKLICFLAVVVIASCGKKKSQDVGDADEKYDVPVNECYAYITAGDTVTMKISRLENTATGELVYKLREKDWNLGSFRGKFAGDTLFADYTFQSEGMTSVREEAFLVRDGRFVKLNGKIVMQGEKQVFESRKNLQPGTIVLSKTVCD